MSVLQKLTTRKVQGNLKAGMHGDGGGLYLKVLPTGGRSWQLRCRVHGRVRYMGLGSAEFVSLSEARKAAHHYRGVARAGGDPFSERRKVGGIPTFADAAKTVWAEQIEPTATNAKHAAQWINTLRTYAFPEIGDRAVDTIASDDVLRVLQPIWLTKPETARRVRQRLRTVFDWTIVKRYRTDANPVHGIEKALAKQGDRAKHFAALPWQDLPTLWPQLEAAAGMGALALRFVILTAARSGEVRGARWSEFDLNAKVWTVPANRMKAKTEHRVPLSDAAVEILEAVQGFDNDLVFPSSKPGRPLSDMTLAAVLKRLDVPVTVHGFRSTFRDWCSDRGNVGREVAEAALAHTLSSKVEAAYSRSDHFDRRRHAMEQWAQFATRGTGQVVHIGERYADP